mmetsp:Transcript_5112/g.12249  ORF Transcript_5112/g.12249 Transcript_5112/m.12249 type:complete len:154 (-) Transcript_5112:435-896(-)
MLSDEMAAEAAFLEQLERKRAEMASQLRTRRLQQKPSRRAPVQALMGREGFGEQFPVLIASIEERRDQEMQEQEMQWARTSALGVLHGGSAVGNSSIYPLREVADGFGHMSQPEADTANFGQSPVRRIRKGHGKRTGLVLSCEGWGTHSDTLS